MFSYVSYISTAGDLVRSSPMYNVSYVSTIKINLLKNKQTNKQKQIYMLNLPSTRCKIIMNFVLRK